jgi:hypothetical protein
LRATEFRGHFGAGGDFIEIELLLAGLGEARRTARRARSGDTGAFQAGALLHFEHGVLLLFGSVPEAVSFESVVGNDLDALGARHGSREHNLDVD